MLVISYIYARKNEKTKNKALRPPIFYFLAGRACSMQGNILIAIRQIVRKAIKRRTPQTIFKEFLEEYTVRYRVECFLEVQE